MDHADAVQADALEAVAHLARSPHRVPILASLADGPRGRRELVEETGASRTTVGRILADLEERGWTERTASGEYEATPRGSFLSREVSPLVEAVAAISHLGDAVDVLPADELSIGLRHFSDADVVRPAPNAPAELGRYHAELLREAGEVYTLTYIAPPVPVAEAIAAGVEDGRLSAVHVMAGGLVDYLREHAERPPSWRRYVESGARVYEYPGHVPCHLFVADETVHVGRPDADPSGTVIESRDGTVRSWAIGLVDAYREEATRLDPEAFPD